jgi:hypothetical protein
MKKFFVSAGLVAASAAGFQSAMADAPASAVSPKAWSVSATLRGFYDDNYNTSPVKVGSAGFEFSPEVSLSIPFRQTEVGLRYTYGLYYYQQREDNGINPIDQSHQLDFWLDHAFNTRWRAKFTDTVAIGQEPELLDPSGSFPFRVEGDNLANHARIELDTEWTRLFSTSLSYANDYYDYRNHGTTLFTGFGPGDYELSTSAATSALTDASLAGLLNRVEQSAALDLQWHFQPQTIFFVGYRFNVANYIGDEPIAVYNFPTTMPTASLVYNSDSRDSVTHYGSVGVQHQFTANLGGSVRLGASYTDNYNDPLNKSTAISPYADMSMTYTYLPGSYLQAGFTQDQNATDVNTVDASGHLTEYEQSSTVYLDINHRFTEKLLGTLITRYEHSRFESGGGSQPGGDNLYSVGVNLAYQITRHFSAEAGYNFDDLVSGVAGRNYNRNRVYVGLGANY